MADEKDYADGELGVNGAEDEQIENTAEIPSAHLKGTDTETKWLLCGYFQDKLSGKLNGCMIHSLLMYPDVTCIQVYHDGRLHVGRAWIRRVAMSGV